MPSVETKLTSKTVLYEMRLNSDSTRQYKYGGYIMSSGKSVQLTTRDPKLNSSDERIYDSQNISKQADHAADSVSNDSKTAQTKLGEHDTRGKYDTVRADHDNRSTFRHLVFGRQTSKDLSAPHLYIR